MARFHLHPIPGLAWPNVPRAEVSQMWSMFLELERTQWLPPEEILEGQLAQVRSLLAHAGREVPYYQELFRQAGIEPNDIRTLADFRRIPILQRRTYQQQSERFQARSLPPPMKATNRLRTSGTSGMPIEVRQTNLVNLWWFAFHLRDLAWCDIDPRGTLAVIRGLSGGGAESQRFQQGSRQSCWSDQLHQLLENGSAYGMDIHQDPRRQLQWLFDIQPDYLLSYPPNLEFLAGLLAESGRRLEKLRAIQTLAETLTDETRARIESGFGVPVKNTYSCVEAGYLASSCTADHGLHVHAENVLLEVLDDDDQPCAPGQTGRVVLTALHNYLTPFIRYEILDGATLGPERCPCGRGLSLLTQVLGKRRPQFHLPDGRRKDSGFLVRRLRQLGDYYQHQVIQHAVDHVIVHVVPSPAWTADHSRQVASWLEEYFETPIRVDVQLETTLKLTPTGKLRDVINELEERGTVS